MTFRTRILLACLAAAILPLAIVAAGARHAVRNLLATQYRERVAASSAAIGGALAATGSAIEARLRTLERQLIEDPAHRAALVDPALRSGLIDVAPDAMAAAGLDYLVLIDENGTVLSSGHFRNEYDRDLGDAAVLLRNADGLVLLSARRPAGDFHAFARARAFELGGRRLTLAGGMQVDSGVVARLAGGGSDALTITLAHPGGRVSSAAAPAGDAVAESITLPFIDAAGSGAGGDALLTISHSLAPLHSVLRGMDRWFVAAFAIAVLLAYLIASVLAARVNRPLEELARRASRVELDRYDVRLATQRPDEVGSLSRLLDRMVQRLRAGAQQLREAERRATVGDMARQVNHDIRNGLLPVRNVVRHLLEVAQESPAELGTVLSERAGTLEGGIGYLENLATNYARLTPRIERQPCDVNALLQTLVHDSAIAGDERITVEPGRSLPHVPADPVALRRVLENLAVNALESLPQTGGSVLVRTEAAAAEPVVIITVADTGSGIAADALGRIFDDFYTTKQRGTGLGLSIVRRLVTDMGGRIGVQSEPGRGTTFTIELPAESRG